MAASTKARIKTLYVQIVPSMDGFFKDIDRETDKEMPKTSRKVNKGLFGGMSESFKKAFKGLNIGEFTKSIKGFSFKDLKMPDFKKPFRELKNLEEGISFKSITDAFVPKNLRSSISNAFKGLDQTLLSSLKGVGAGLGNILRKGVQAAKVGALVLGGLAVAGVATVVKKGFDRALNIEDAQASLKGLGYEAEQIEGITDNVLSAVKGTAFSLDESMSTAATALAAGVPQGEGLTNYLKLIGDTATITKSSMGDIGSILNKVTAGGRAYTQELNQLQDRGLPVFTWLQEEFGATADEMRKMVSSGEVSSEHLMKVLEKNIGGAAQASGDTVRGAWANTMAALGRLGAGGVGASLPFIKDALNLIIPFIDTLTEKLRPLSEAFWETFGPKMLENLSKLLDGAMAFIDGLSQADGSKLGGLAGMLGVFQPLLAIIQAIGPLLPQLIAALAPIAQLVGEVLMPAFADLLTQLQPVIESLITLIIDVLGALIPVIAEILPILVPIIQLLAQLLVPVIWLLVEVLGNILPPIITFLGAMIKTVLVIILAAVQGFMAIIIGIVNGFIWVANAFGAGWTPVELPVVQLPALATGGNVAASNGGTAVVLGEGGRDETVTDLGLTNSLIANANRLAAMALGAGGGGNSSTVVNIEINQKDGQDTQALVDALDEYFVLNSLKPAGWN